MEIAKREPVVETETSRHGVKYVVDGLIMTPSGSKVRLWTVWIVDKGQGYPRLLTAYPS